MSRCKYSLVSATLVGLACTALQAQSPGLRATVPFDFRAGRTVLPAGEYVISEDGAVVIFKSAGQGGPSSILFSTGANSWQLPHEGRLEFDHFGREYFLTAIWSPFDKEGRQVPKTKRQQELAKRSNAPVIVSLSSTK